MSDDTEDGLSHEFTEKSVIGGALRVALLIASIIAFLVGVGLFEAMKPSIVGVLIMLVALSVQAFGVYQSARDRSGFKWPNIIGKALMRSSSSSSSRRSSGSS